MRLSLLIVGMVAAAHVASASTVVVLSDPTNGGALGSALQVSLAGRGVAIATLPAPAGALRLDRAAAAQHAALSFNADAALWIDQEADSTEVCAVSADGRFFRHAPLPIGEGDTPRMFAAIGTSLLDELIQPPDAPAIDVDVHVHLDPHGPTGPVVATLDPPSMIAPGVVAPGIGMQQAMDAPVERPRMDRSLFEFGPMLSPVTVGVEGGLMVPVGSSFRLGGAAALDVVTTDSGHEVLTAFMGELRHVGRGRHHWDFGPVAGYAFVVQRTNDASPLFGARISYNWEGDRHGNSISIVPMVFTPSSGGMGPGIYASYRWELPL
jgi:hypothetical protein